MSFSPGAHSVLQFWLGARPYSAIAVEQRAPIWFAGLDDADSTAQWDEVLRERFAPLLQRAAHQELSAWESSPRRRLALVLLLHQFPRHIYRGTAAAFNGDATALALTLSGIRDGADATLDPVERLSFYLPLMHAEAADVQEEALATYRHLQQTAPPAMQATFTFALRRAQQCQQTIASFGRFPQRNAALARPNTAAEVAWLSRLTVNRAAPAFLGA